MHKNAVFLIFLSVLAGLNLGTVRKSEDPIRDTQTNPILYQQKMEEEKDGKKGPLLYHVKNYPRESFFIDPPFEKIAKQISGSAVAKEMTAPAEVENWWEEQPAASSFGTSSFEEAVPSASADPLLEEKTGLEEKAAEQPVKTPPAEGVSAGKEEDYWW